jgi:hypothetical protein
MTTTVVVTLLTVVDAVAVAGMEVVEIAPAALVEVVVASAGTAAGTLLRLLPLVPYILVCLDF